MKRRTFLKLLCIIGPFLFNSISLAQTLPLKRGIDINTVETQTVEIPFSFSLGTFTLSDAIQMIAQDADCTLEELQICLQAMQHGKKGIDALTLEPLMPYIIKRIAPELLENDTPETLTLDTMITRAQRRESQPCSINKDWNTPVTPASCDLSAVLRLLCLIQKQIEICCREIKIEIRECCEEIIETITECCEELSEEIAECCEELSLEIEELQETLEECCEEIQEDIEECCEEIIETITECCADIIERIESIRSCGTFIDSLPTVISEPGYYILQNTTPITTSDAITITSSNVTLDLCGNTIIGNGTFNGIVVDGGDLGINNITLSNGRIDAMDNGVVGENAQAIHAFGLTVTNSANGFNLINCQDSFLNDCTASSCTEHGFLLQGQIPPVVRAHTEKCTGCDIVGVTNRHNTVQNCQAIGTHSETSSVYGFRSIAGLNNVFITCLAKNTRTDDTTFASIAAGFSLESVNFGTIETPVICGECGSQIIECEICDTTAAEETDPNLPGGSTPIGILLSPTFDPSLFVETSTQIQGETVTSVSWSPDGCYLVSGATDADVNEFLKVWKIDEINGQLTQVFTGAANGLNAVAWSYDSCFVVTGDSNGELTSWKVDKTTGNLSNPITTVALTNFFSVSWSPNSCFVATGESGGVQIWKVNKVASSGIYGTLESVDTATTDSLVTSVAFSPDGSYLAAGSVVDELFVYPVLPSGELDNPETQTIDGAFNSVAWSPDGCFLATGSAENGQGFIRIWKIRKEDGSPIDISSFEIFGESVTSVAWSPLGNFLITGSTEVAEGHVRVWEFDPATGTLTNTGINVTLGDMINSVAYSPNGCFAAAGVSSGTEQLYAYDSAIIYPNQCTVKRNQISRVFGGCGGFGIQGGCNNLIINNLVYEADYGFAGVSHVYRSGLGGFPGFFDNIQVPPFCFPCGICCPVLCPELIPTN